MQLILKTEKVSYSKEQHAAVPMMIQPFDRYYTCSHAIMHTCMHTPSTSSRDSHTVNSMKNNTSHLVHIITGLALCISSLLEVYSGACLSFCQFVLAQCQTWPWHKRLYRYTVRTKSCTCMCIRALRDPLLTMDLTNNHHEGSTKKESRIYIIISRSASISIIMRYVISHTLSDWTRQMSACI